MKPYICTLRAIRRGDWLIKASSFDDQILIFLYNARTIDLHIRMFYNEELAFNYIESLLNVEDT